MSRKFVTINCHEDVKAMLRLIAEDDSMNKTLRKIISPIADLVTDLRTIHGYKVVTLKVTKHPMRPIVIIEIFPQDKFFNPLKKKVETIEQ